MSTGAPLSVDDTLGGDRLGNRAAQVFHVTAKGLPRPGIDHRQWRGHRQTSRRSDSGGRTRGHLDDAIAQPNAGIRHRLALS